MHRVLTALVALVMLSTSASMALQHVHEYVDHDHADHHHGPASHGHSSVARAQAPESHAPDDAARLEGCDPGEHVVSVAFIYVAAQPDHVPVPVMLDAIVVTPPKETWRHVALSDVRAHGPPRLTDAPLRAPPVVHLA